MVATATQETEDTKKRNLWKEYKWKNEGGEVVDLSFYFNFLFQIYLFWTLSFCWSNYQRLSNLKHVDSNDKALV